MTATQKMAAELARKGNFDIFAGDTMTHQTANALMKRSGKAID